jgi:transposase
MVERIRNDYNLKKIVLVGDRGMIGDKSIEILKPRDGIDWITALRSISIKKLVEENDIKPSKFDDTNILEIHAPEDYPGERLIFYRNHALAKRRSKVRLELIEDTEKILDPIKKQVDTGKLQGESAIRLTIGRCIDKYHMKKYFILNISDNSFTYNRDIKKISAEKLLDGIYVIRTSLSAEFMESESAVRGYKNLSMVERAFRSIKTEDLCLRPIWYYDEKRVKTHLFICMLAYYVIWHIKEAWRPMTFADEEIDLKYERNPVALAEPSESAKKKISSKKTELGFDALSFKCLFDRFSMITKSNVIIKIKDISQITYRVQSKMDPLQAKAFELLETIKA